MNWSDIVTTTAALMQGFGVVMMLFAVTLAAAMPLGFFLTLLTRSRFAPLRWLTNGYIYLMRATPLMLQLFFIYFGMPLVSDFFKRLFFSAVVCAMVGFVLNYAAYFAEIFRGGLPSTRGNMKPVRCLD